MCESCWTIYPPDHPKARKHQVDMSKHTTLFTLSLHSNLKKISLQVHADTLLVSGKVGAKATVGYLLGHGCHRRHGQRPQGVRICSSLTPIRLSHCFNHAANLTTLCLSPRAHLPCRFTPSLSFFFSFFSFFSLVKNGGNTAAKENALIANTAMASFMLLVAGCCWYLFTLNNMEFFPWSKGTVGQQISVMSVLFVFQFLFFFLFLLSATWNWQRFNIFQSPSLSFYLQTPPRNPDLVYLCFFCVSICFSA